jgi:serine/threonine-protein kinase RsbW
MARIPLDQDPNACEMVIPTDLGAAKASEREILRKVEQHGYSEVSRFAIKLALEEAITNAVKHGNRNDPSKRIVIRFSVTPEEAVIWLTDEGRGFNPDGVPDPTLDENLGKPNGRGIMLMRAYMDEVSFGNCGREVRLVKVNRA